MIKPFLSAALFLAAVIAPAVYSANLVRVIDGDTVVVETNGVELRVRLYGIDCPELYEPGGKAAKAFTGAFLTNGRVEIEPHGFDRYGRTVGRVFVNGDSLEMALVRSGHARVWWRYIREAWLRKEYEKLLSETTNTE